MEKVKVSVIIPTYNHEPYIRKAIESALAQECSFPFEIIIGEDGSTDGTGEICREYEHLPNLRLISNAQNLGLIGNYRSLFSAAMGEYLAILEGDDFWEKHKLARQIGYLESNPECGLVHSNGFFLFENGKHSLIHREPVDDGYGFKELFRKNLVVSVTVCFRKSLLKHADPEQYESLGFRTVDYPLWLEFSQHTRLGYIHEPLATYRITAGSISNSRSIEKRHTFELSNRAILEYYLQKYPADGLDRATILARYNEKMFYTILAFGNYQDLEMLSAQYLRLPRYKMLAIKNRGVFLLYRAMVRLFHRRI